MPDALKHQSAGNDVKTTQRKDEKALAVIDKLVKAFPDREDLQASKSYCLGRLGRLDEAFRICNRLQAARNTPRVQHLKIFLDKQQGFLSDTSVAPAPISPSPGPDGVLTPALAKKLEIVRRNIEREFSEFRTREAEATSTIQKLRSELLERRQNTETLQDRNEELERLIAEVSSDVVGLGIAPKSAPRSEGVV